jgi:hypothetical protein
METFYGNPVLYPMICHPDTLDFPSLISSGKIILLSLGIDEEKVPGTERQLLGAMLVSQLQMGAMKAWKERQRNSFYLYIDEVQNFVTTSLDEALAAALKYGLHLTIANQYLGQLKGKTLESVMGNVGASVVFQIGLNDARLLASHFRPEFEADALGNLELYHAAVKTRLGRETLPAFSLETRPAPGDASSEIARAREQYIRTRSIEQYTPKTLNEVLGWLSARYPRKGFGPPVGSDGKGSNDDWVVSSVEGE